MLKVKRFIQEYANNIIERKGEGFTCKSGKLNGCDGECLIHLLLTDYKRGLIGITEVMTSLTEIDNNS